MQTKFLDECLKMARIFHQHPRFSVVLLADVHLCRWHSNTHFSIKFPKSFLIFFRFSAKVTRISTRNECSSVHWYFPWGTSKNLNLRSVKICFDKSLFLITLKTLSKITIKWNSKYYSFIDYDITFRLCAAWIYF